MAIFQMTDTEKSMPEGKTHLTREQRNHIQRYRDGMPVQQIADDLGVHRSTVYHELRRNGDGIGRYDAEVAHRRACERRTRASRIPRKIPPDFIGHIRLPPIGEWSGTERHGTVRTLHLDARVLKC